ncbi:MAG: hypothetical protein Q9157_006315 [Trypethelium eluteriae]
MRIRKAFAGTFVVTCLAAAYLGLAPAQQVQIPQRYQSDKVLHFLTFSVITNGREFDLYDIIANVTGSLAAVGLSTLYHKRMLERKRQAKYDAVPGEEGAEADLELGEGIGPQETGVAEEPTTAAATADDNWDNDADNWEEEDQTTGTESAEGDGKTTPSTSVDTELANGKKRDD